MEILQEGTVPAPELWHEEVTCKADDKHDTEEKCGAVLKITAADLVLRYYKGSHFNHYYTAIRCPRCLKWSRVFPPEVVWRPLHSDENRAKAMFDGFGD